MFFQRKKESVSPSREKSSKPDLIQYLQSLPDVDVPYPPIPEKEESPEPEGQIEIWKAQIDQASRKGLLVASKVLTAENKDFAELLPELDSQPEIGRIKGRKDIYYYAVDRMTVQYAEVMMLVTEQDIAYTIAEVTRKRSRYPATTPLRHFTREPYYWSRPQIDRAMDQIRALSEYQDIHAVSATNGEVHFYSVRHISDVYGQALADDAEEEDM